MTPEFKFKTDSIKFLSISGFDINNFSKLDEFLKNGEQLLHLFINEINNNKYILNLEYRGYLNDLKNLLWDLFQKDSYQTKNRQTVEYNLLAYYNDYEKYNDQSNLKEYHTIYDICKNNLDLSAINSFKELFSLKTDNSYRKIGELPYTVYPSDHLLKFIKIIEKGGNLDKLRWYVHNYNDPYLINDCIIRPIYYRILLICTEEIRTHFLWIIIGNVLKQVKELESSEKKIESCFKDQNDFVKIAAILRDKLGVIGNNNQWLGVPRNDPKTGMEKIDTTKTAVLGLIECLELKQYLKSNNNTAIGLAFCRAFNISLKERALRQTPKNHQIYFDFFSKGIPKRVNL